MKPLLRVPSARPPSRESGRGAGRGVHQSVRGRKAPGPDFGNRAKAHTQRINPWYSTGCAAARRLGRDTRETHKLRRPRLEAAASEKGTLETARNRAVSCFSE